MTSAIFLFLVNIYKKRRMHRRAGAEAVYTWTVLRLANEANTDPIQCRKSLNLSVYNYWSWAGAVNVAADEIYTVN